MKIPTTTLFPGANGSIKLNLGIKGALKSVEIIGGPFDQFPGRNKAFGVAVRAERISAGQADVHLPIRDFDVPRSADTVELALLAAFRAALLNRPVWVGCMGGWGRTGLFLALMAKVAGCAEPVDFVRKEYTPRAVETREQLAYVQAFDVSRVRFMVLRMAWRARLGLL